MLISLLLPILPGDSAVSDVSAILGIDAALGVDGLLGVWVVDAKVGLSGWLDIEASPVRSLNSCCSSLSPSAGLTTNLPEFEQD